MFPEKANISFAEVLAPDAIKLRVWERGVGITLGCGSAACATLVAASRLGLTGRTARIELPGGALTIDWRASDDHVLMTGPVEFEREIELKAEMFAGAPAGRGGAAFRRVPLFSSACDANLRRVAGDGRGRRRARLSFPHSPRKVAVGREAAMRL